MKEVLIRFLIGGAVVSAFAAIGDMFKPKTFAGLFGAAPSVALATIGLTIAHEGTRYAAIEGRSMIAGAVAFLVYAVCTSHLMMRLSKRAWVVTAALLPLWFAVAFALSFAGL